MIEVIISTKRYVKIFSRLSTLHKVRVVKGLLVAPHRDSCLISQSGPPSREQKKRGDFNTEKYQTSQSQKMQGYLQLQLIAGTVLTY